MVKFPGNLDTQVFFLEEFFTALALGSELLQVVIVAKNVGIVDVNIRVEIEAFLAGLTGQAVGMKGQIRF